MAEYSFSALSHGIAALSFFLLAALLGKGYLRRNTDRTLFVATLVSIAWASSIATQALWSVPPFIFRYLLELVRDALWIMVLFALIKDSAHHGLVPHDIHRWLSALLLLVIGLLLGTGVAELTLNALILDGKPKLVGQIAVSLLGLVLLEQLWRNASLYGRSSVKYLCLGIGALFGYDFFLYSDALLFGQMSQPLWEARGAVNALIVPLLATTLINARKQPLELQLSRHVVFHVGTLFLAGAYLLIVAAGGYYVRAIGGTWGEAIQIVFLFAFALLFVLLLSSSRFRARLMMFVSQNFFDYKYDYREEWLKLTQEFADWGQGPPLPERVIRIIAQLVKSNAGAIWTRDEDNQLTLRGTLNLRAPRYSTIPENSELLRFFLEREWILDLQEYQRDPVKYNLLELPECITDIHDAWLVVPLYLSQDVYGLVVVASPYTRVDLNWENYDLLRVVARQACNFIAQADAQQQLTRALQFDAVNRASAFMLHDLKTLIAQLSLLVSNAQRHRNNPAFVDDMIRTTEHAVGKMRKLVEHIHKPDTDHHRTLIDLNQLLTELVADHQQREPRPTFNDESGGEAKVLADRGELRSVLGHLIQNAQDATPRDGEVSVTLKRTQDAAVMFFLDTGSGMTEDFIRHQLFKPFTSTKGLTGMGIGAYQAQTYIRKLGGSIDVTSEPGMGSCFSVKIPLAPICVDSDVDSSS